MRRRHKYILFLLFLGVYFLLPNNVFADAKKIGTCTYVVPDYFPSLSGFKLAVTIYDDKTTTRKATLGDWSANNDEIYKGLPIDNTGMVLDYKKMFNKNGRFYKEYDKKKGCPTLQFIWSVYNYALYFNIVETGKSAEDPNGYASALLSPTMTGTTSTNNNKPNREVICTRKKNVLQLGYELQFTFAIENKKKILEIGEVANNNTIAILYPEDDNQVYFNGLTFRVNDEDIDAFWKSKKSCKGEFFLYEGLYSYLQIQRTKPDDYMNGSVKEEDADQDTGTEDIDAESSEIGFVDMDNPLDCKTLLGDINDEDSVAWLLMKILNYLKILGPILVIILSSLDFIKAIISSDEESMKKASKRFTVRLVLAISLFFVPMLVGWALQLTGVVTNDPTCGFNTIDSE